MKKILTIIIIIMGLQNFAQQKIAQKISEFNTQKTKYNHFLLFDDAKNAENITIKDVLKKATSVKLITSVVSDVFINKYDNIELEIPYQNQMIEIQLFKVDLFAENFHIDTDKNANINYQKGVYYRGIIKGDNQSIVSFNFFSDECNAVISSKSLGNLVVGKLVEANNTKEYIVYKDQDLTILNTFKCNTKETVTNTETNLNKNSETVNSTRCVTIYFEIDFDIYSAKGNNTASTTNWLTSVFNNVQTIYANDGITTAVKSVFIWTTLDPYNGIGPSSSDYLYKFNEIRPVFDGDLGQLLGTDAGGLGGVAVGLQGLCSNNNFSYSDVNINFNVVPQYSWTINVITHELGHLMGSAHTHDCAWNGNNTRIDDCGPSAGYPGNGDCAESGNIPDNGGTIMSYCHLGGNSGINFAFGFGSQPAARILNKVNNGTCLSTNCVNTCINKILSSVVSNVSSTSARLDWIEQNNSISSEVAFYPLSATSGSFTSPIVNNFTANNLLPNTYYKAVVRKKCTGGLLGPEIVKIFATNGNFCSGISLTDSGGPTADYLDNETVVRTIIPANPLTKATITFTAFDLELDYDYLNVYNGNSEASPQLSPGLGFTGNTIPAPITSTALNGSLTLKFYSDGGVVAPGYIATVSCASLVNQNFENNIDFSYYPNPVNNILTVNSKTEISEILIYNIAGQLLYSNKINDFTSKIDISEFATGTYFFKLKFNEKEVNFKISKI